MKHKGSLIINKPREEVVALFMTPDSRKEYQDGFERSELLQGSEGHPGAKTKLEYKYGKRDMVLIETVLKNGLPHSFEAHYHHQHMDNTMKCTFRALDANRTEYGYEFEYTRIDWFMPKLMAILFPSMYRKQGDKWMKQFKEFVEKQ